MKLWELILILILILILLQIKFKENPIWCLIDLTLPDKKEVPIIFVVHVFDYLPRGPTPLLMLFQTSYLSPHEKNHVTKYIVQPMWPNIYIPFQISISYNLELGKYPFIFGNQNNRCNPCHNFLSLFIKYFNFVSFHFCMSKSNEKFKYF